MKEKKEDNTFQEIPVSDTFENLKNYETNIIIKDEIWNNYLGVLIFLFVFVNFLQFYISNVKNNLIYSCIVFIYTFHIPALTFCLGCMTKLENPKIKDKTLKLLIYYTIFNSLIIIVLNLYQNEIPNFFHPYYSYSYLLCLINWRIILNNFNINNNSIILMIFLLALINGYSISFSNNLLSIGKTIILFPFFISGYLSQEIINRIILKMKIIKKIIICVFFILCYIGLFYCIRNKIIYFSENILMMEKYNSFKEIKKRFLLFIIAFIMLLLLLLLMPNKKIILFSKAGKNSLYIYLFHKIVSLLFKRFFELKKSNIKIIVYALILTIIIIILFGNDILSKNMEKLNKYIYDNISNNTEKGKKIKFYFVSLIFFIILLNPIKIQIKKYLNKPIKNLENNLEINSNNTLSNVHLKSEITHLLTNELKQKLNSSIRISYIGDLILLKQQVISAYNKELKKYDFNDIFKYTKDHFKKSDLTIGVFEGPTAGGGIEEYSTSNYDDGIKLHLNFPDEFAEAVKNSGINFVTTANNHLLDKGIKGAMRTLDILDKYNIEHIGSYRNEIEKENNKIKILNVENVKIAFLAYTQYMNYYGIKTIYEKYPFLTSILPNEKHIFFEKILEEIKKDIEKVKNSGADLIAVLLHMGTQFLHSPDRFQQKWNKIFTDLNVDIILGDHPHSVQTIEYVNNNNTIIINCPGNFVNSYIKNDGDATAIVDLYIDKKTKKIIGCSVIPMYTKQIKKGYFIALPIYNIVKKNLNESISEFEMDRINDVQNLITKVMLRKQVSLYNSKENYYFINNTYYSESSFIKVVEKYKDKELYKLINNSNNITFIGDSITEGTRNNFHPWYEPLINSFDNKLIINIAKGGYTTKKILTDFQNHILESKTDLYIIAIGTNDVRYRDNKTCAMDKENYIIEINKIVDLIKISNLNSKIVFIAPWKSLSGDLISLIHGDAKEKLFDEYSMALEEYCEKNNFLYINPNPYLKEIINDNTRHDYMYDFIHPNDNKGIELYSEAVLNNS